MKRKLLSGLIAVLIIAGTVTLSYWLIQNSKKNQEAEAAAIEERELPAPNVRVKVLKEILLEDRLELSGSLEPFEDLLLSAELRGNLEWQGAKEGEAVKAGQELFRINTDVIQASLAQARAQMKLADQEFERMQRLSGQGVIPAQELDRAVANKDVAAANVRALEVQSSQSLVRATMVGTVDQIFLEEGEFADVGSPLVKLVRLDKLKVEVGVPERDVLFFKEGDAVHIRLDSMPGREFPGTIHRIAATGDSTSRTFPAEIVLDNPGGTLKPGMIARASFIRATHPGSIMIPIFSSIPIDDERYAFVVEDGVAVVRKLDVGIVQGSEVQITGGLSPGEQLVVSGQYDVREGEPVNITEIIE
ncbi:MAG: efflux RND transporter periplasmic adaptor subunit [Candidatus Hydrogenedentes bacterium]|nr:efflux RND transporter periplasmic adaptor subunit [Candidatus Hydrogenedentota bacterium]